jgi:hypothetical protein
MNNNIFNSIYIGNIKKNHKGGLQIINDSEDKNIIQQRNFILNELSTVFKGGKDLMYEDIPHYAQALEGKYIRNKMCKGGNPKCIDACNLVKKSYDKLIRKSLNEFNNPNLLNIISGGSPYLFRKIGVKYNRVSGNSYDYDSQNGGNIEDKLLNQLRLEINKIRFPDTCI